MNVRENSHDILKSRRALMGQNLDFGLSLASRARIRRLLSLGCVSVGDTQPSKERMANRPSSLTAACVRAVGGPGVFGDRRRAGESARNRLTDGADANHGAQNLESWTRRGPTRHPLGIG